MIWLIPIAGLVGAGLGYVLSCKTDCSTKKYVPWLKPGGDGKAPAGAEDVIDLDENTPRATPISYRRRGPRRSVMGAESGCVLEMERRGDVLLWVAHVGPRLVHGQVNLPELFEAVREAQRRVAEKHGVRGIEGIIPAAMAVMQLAQNKVVQDSAKKLIKQTARRLQSARRGNPRARAEIRRDLRDPNMRPIVENIADRLPPPPPPGEEGDEGPPPRRHEAAGFTTMYGGAESAGFTTMYGAEGPCSQRRGGGAIMGAPPPGGCNC